MEKGKTIGISLARVRFSPVFVWFLGLILFSVNCFNIIPIAGIFSGEKGLIIYLLWLFGGCAVIKRERQYLLLNWNNVLPVILILSGIVLSFLPAYLYYGQSFFRSFIACRVGLVYLTLPALLWVRPSLKDIKKALFLFSALFFVLMIFDSYLNIPLIAKDEQAILRAERLEMRDESDVNFLGGVHFVAMAFFFSLEDTLKHWSAKQILISILFFLTVLLYQNRSTLFACVLITAFLFLTLPNTRRNIKIKSILIFVAILVFAGSFGMWKSLLTETGEQVVNSDYNRNLAYAYFLLEAPQGLLNYILGCGFLSSKTTSLMQDMMELGVYNSDVGFIGMWNQFGLIPIFTIAVYCLYNICKEASFQVRTNSAFILLCSLTIAYFFDPSKILWLCIFLYIISLDGFRKKHIGER